LANYELRSTQSRGSFRVSGPLTKVGRATDNGVVLNDPTISRYHLNFYVRDDGSLVIENAGAQSGFLLNGQPASGPSLANHGDRLAFGALEYVVVRDGMPLATPSAPPRAATNIGGVPLYEAASKVRVSSSSARPKVYALLALAIGAIVYLGKRGDDTARTPSSVSDFVEGGLASPIDSEGYRGDRKAPLSQTEIEAEGYFRAGMRDLHNANYTRALQFFQQARTKNPGHAEATYYIEQTETQLRAQLDALLKDANRSFSFLQYTRAKIQAVRVLTILADQIPAYSRKLASEAMARPTDQPAPTHEESLIRIDCKLTKDAEACGRAIRLIKESRNRLGEENELR